MRDLIKKTLREALGVPEGIIGASKKLYDEFTEYFFDVLTQGTTDYDFLVIPKNEMNIGGLKIDEVNFNVEITETDKVDEVDSLGMGVASTVDFNDKESGMMKVVDKGGVVRFQIHLVAPENWKEQDFKDYFKKDRNKLISSFAHEIKHEFDDYKKPSISLKERIDYDMAKDMMKGITPLRKFAFLLYFIHKIENLVRPTEIASLLDSEQISKKEFISFIKNNSTYKHLEEAKQMSYDLLKAEMVEYIDKIKEIFDDNDVDYSYMSESEILDEMLRIFYVTIANKKLSRFNDIMTDNIFEQIFGFSGKKLEQVSKYQNYVVKFEKKPLDYFKYESNHMNFVADKMIRKLMKLYDMAK